jgi:hypothetical protein
MRGASRSPVRARLAHVALVLVAVAIQACERTTSDAPADRASDPTFMAVPDSEWVDVSGPTLIAFYPIVSDDEIERDADLATVLDDFSYHIGTAMDSLDAAGFKVHYRGGDTIWTRSGSKRSRLLRPADSASIGYVWTDTLGHQSIIYGVRTYIDLIEYAHEFRRTGRLAPR